MKVLMTGHNGYIGSVMGPLMERAGHHVIGLDTYLFEQCTFGPETEDRPASRMDIRDVSAEDLAGFDAVVHLAALSNDPLGNLNARATYEINHEASVQLARLAKAAGVPRFLFASSCSLYGVAGEDMLDETASFNPITPYGESKVLVERDVKRLADDHFSPTFLRNATAYGVSPRLRADVVINNLVGYAFTTGKVMIQSDGTPWRPLVHVEDFSRAFLAALEAPRELVHNQAFNVGQTSENYQIRELGQIVRDVVSGSEVTFAANAGPDPRSYRVNCDKLATTLTAYQPTWNVRRGIEELYRAFQEHRLTELEFLGNRYFRIKHITALQNMGSLDGSLRWQVPVSSEGGAA